MADLTFWEKVNRGLKAGATADDIIDKIAADRPETADAINQARANGVAPDEILSTVEPMVSRERTAEQQANTDFAMIPTGRKMAIGIGKGMTDLAQGVGQLAGVQSTQDVEAKRARDEAISQNPVGRVGTVIGETAPLVAIPVGGAGALTARGLEALRLARGARAARSVVGDSAIVGSAAGATRPVTENESRGVNTATGTVVGGAIPVALGAAKLGSDAVENILRTPEEAAGKIMSEVATNPAAARGALANPEVLVPGAVPTTAQATRDLGLLGLERTLRQRNPADWTADDIARNAARLKELKRVTGSDELAAREAAREQVGKAVYEPLMNANVKVDKDLTGLLANPVMKDAWDKAKELAAIDGVSLQNAADQVSGRGLHYMKLALDDISSSAQKAAARGEGGTGASKARAIGGVQQKFNGWLEANVPEYQAARKAYADASKPVAKAEAGQAMLSRAETGIKDVSGNPVLTPADFNKKLAANLTNKYGDVFTPDEVGILTNIGKDVERSVLANTVKGTAGSDTAQNLVAQRSLSNTLRQVPLAGEFLAARASGRDADVSALLDQAMRDPAKAKQLLDLVKAGDRSKVAMLLEKGRQAISRASSVAGPALASQQQQ